MALFILGVWLLGFGCGGLLATWILFHYGDSPNAG